MKHIDNYISTGKESETLLINQLSLLRAENKQEVYKFGFGQSPFPIPEKITQSLAQAAARKEYMSVQGDPKLRSAIAQFHRKFEHRNFDADNIIIGTGSKILIFSVLAAFNKVEVILPAPSWVSYEPQAKLVGHKVKWLETNFENRWRLTPQTLDDYCKQRKNPDVPLILVLNYPNNPTGQSFDTEELKALAGIMQKHHIIVIADEIYSLLKLNGKQASIADFYPQGTIISSGISKWCGAGGWRLGFVHIPKELGKKLFRAVIGVASETYSCAAAPIQIAATTAYTEENIAHKFLQQQRDLLNTVNKFCTQKLNQARIRTHACIGGFYLFPDFSAFKKELSQRNITNSNELTHAIMEDIGVALLPGTAFGMPACSLTARLAFVDFDGSQILNEGNIAHFDKLKKGIEKLCLWANNL